MTGAAIAAQALADAALRLLATEYGGPRPTGVRERDRPAPAPAPMRAERP